VNRPGRDEFNHPVAARHPSLKRRGAKINSSPPVKGEYPEGGRGYENRGYSMVAKQTKDKIDNNDSGNVVI